LRTLTPEYFLTNCRKTYNITYGPQLERYNKYGGVNLSFPRLPLSMGQLDPFRPLGPPADFLPTNGPHTPNPRAKNNGTDAEPQIVIKGGYHEWDFPGVLATETGAAVLGP
jgi:hypothetical protein